MIDAFGNRGIATGCMKKVSEPINRLWARKIGPYGLSTWLTTYKQFITPEATDCQFVRNKTFVV
jgi:hypothetical protein